MYMNDGNSKRNHLLYLDTKDDSYELIPTSGKMKPYKVAIFFSGLERSLKNSKYNLRQDECKAAAYALMGYAGMDYDTFANEEKPKEPKGNLAVPPFYCYRACDVKRIQEALDNGCGYDAPGSFAAWLSKQTPMHAYVMPGKRYDIGDINSYEYVKSVFSR